MTKLSIKRTIVAAVFGCWAVFAIAANAQTAGERKQGPVTGLPLPRFVSLKADTVNARVGPGGDYAIGFVFRKAGLAVELLGEFESWRQVRDSDNNSGWVAAPLVSGRRTGTLAPWKKDGSLFQITSSRNGSTVVAQIEPGALVDIETCDGEVCRVYAGKSSGYLPQTSLWGVYPGEKVN